MVIKTSVSTGAGYLTVRKKLESRRQQGYNSILDKIPWNKKRNQLSSTLSALSYDIIRINISTTMTIVIFVDRFVIKSPSYSYRYHHELIIMISLSTASGPRIWQSGGMLGLHILNRSSHIIILYIWKSLFPSITSGAWTTKACPWYNSC